MPRRARSAMGWSGSAAIEAGSAASCGCGTGLHSGRETQIGAPGEYTRAQQVSAPQPILHTGPQDTQAIDNRSAKADLTRVLEIPRGTGYFADAHPERKGLDQHLVVEDEIVGIGRQRQGLDDPTREGAVPGMKFGQLGANDNVLQSSKDAIGDVFVTWHAARDGRVAENAGTNDDIVDAGGDHRRHG